MKCMGVSIKHHDADKCRNCELLARAAKGADDDKIKDWNEFPKMPCGLYRPKNKGE